MVTSTPASSGSPATDNSSARPAPGVPADLLPFAEPSTAPLPDNIGRDLQAVLDSEITEASFDGVAGVTAAAVTPDGTWSGAAGADGQGQALVPQAIMGIASITKTVVAAEVLHLVDSGVIELDTPASTYLQQPSLTRGPTVRQLLSHTSGVGEYTTDKLYEAVATGSPDRTWTPDEVLASSPRLPIRPEDHSRTTPTPTTSCWAC